MENHLASENNFDPFKIFEMEYSFELNNLDEIYFKLYKKEENKEEINKAYNILKDDLKRAKKLCQLNGFEKTDQSLAKEIFQIMNLSLDEKKQIKETTFKMIFQYALEKNWKKTWFYLQKYSYLERMISQTF